MPLGMDATKWHQNAGFEVLRRPPGNDSLRDGISICLKSPSFDLLSIPVTPNASRFMLLSYRSIAFSVCFVTELV